MISSKERKRYVLKERRDAQILNLVHDLEKMRLSHYEHFLLLWTRTQLEKDWRKPLLLILKTMKRYSKKHSLVRFRKMKQFADNNFWRP